MLYRVEYLSKCCEKQESALIIADSMHNAFDIAIKVYGDDILSIFLGGGGEGRSGNEAPAPAPMPVVNSKKEGGVHILGLDTNKHSYISTDTVNNLSNFQTISSQSVKDLDNWKIVKFHGWRLKLSFKIEQILRELGNHYGNISYQAHRVRKWVKMSHELTIT
jgi:hypothetical protein